MTLREIRKMSEETMGNDFRVSQTRLSYHIWIRKYAPERLVYSTRVAGTHSGEPSAALSCNWLYSNVDLSSISDDFMVWEFSKRSRSDYECINALSWSKWVSCTRLITVIIHSNGEFSFPKFKRRLIAYNFSYQEYL